ncbi:Flp family type IVb pilin [Serpentinicella sp. ANB-PHB4]|uniref:Flp family type IVb pilin n=1 Tax=Serpentinicella sp. ANB-PHB4 TaxID=3074076 RepID=UPI002865AA3B|nr:Flp family type IVb pilin [Serpentinicella sp. ANB-PHB4]MDR5658934.1 Flp family type IVb pilin [Serpentinicella sp. ANB-PHB4]
MKLFKRLWKEEAGQGMTEYGLIIGIISVVLITVLVAFRGKLTEIFESITNSTEI